LSSDGHLWKDGARLLAKAFLLLLINAAACVVVLSLHARQLDFAPWETDSVLLPMPRNTAYGVAILGSSHAHIMGRSIDNHFLCESVLETSVSNMASPFGGGLTPARLYLERFFERGNHAEEVVYFLDPFVFFSPGLNETHKFVYYEPLDLPLLGKLVQNRFPSRRILTYVRSKFSWDWLTRGPELVGAQFLGLKSEDILQENIQGRIDSLYDKSLGKKHFRKYRGELEGIAALCRAQGSRLRLMTPPTLLGPEPGAETMHAWIAAQKDALGVTSHDFVDAMPDPKFYYDLDHLNTRGLEHFLRNYVKPALRP
jgi:hypothetical protein